MWQNYLLAGFRSFTKSATYVVVNIAGLAIGLAACLILLLYVRYETSYDEWLPNAANVYQLQNFVSNSETGESFSPQMTQYVAGTTLKQDFPQIEQAVYAYDASPHVLRNGEAVVVENALAVNGPFFDILQLPFASGDPHTALSNAQSVVLSESEARRLLGTANPVGRTLTIADHGRRLDFRITGVMRDIPRNSHLRINMVMRVDPNSYFADEPQVMTDWGSIGGWNYVRLAPGTDPAAIHAAMPAWERRNLPPVETATGNVDRGSYQDWRLTNVRDVHTGDAQDGTMSPGTDPLALILFSTVAVLILAMASINFVNLTTARASQRAREVALRKVLGASRGQLVAQFLTESIIVVAAAMMIALALTELLLPSLSSFLELDLRLTYLGKHGLLIPIIVTVVVVGSVGGIYPALFLSRFHPAEVLRTSHAGAGGDGVRLRTALVVAQFAISIALIICTAVIYAQTIHARTLDPGFHRDGLLQIGNFSREQLGPRQESLAREISRLAGVESAARTSIGISTPSYMSRTVHVPGRSEPVEIGNYATDQNFMHTMGIRLVAGRLLDDRRPLDRVSVPIPSDPAAERALEARGGNVVLNRLAAAQLGFESPRAALGQQVRVKLSSAPGAGLVPVTIVGIVDDSRFRSARGSIETIMYRLGDDYLSHLMVRHQGSDPRAVRDRIHGIWRRLAPDVPFDARASDEILTDLYESEDAQGQVFAAFALLAIIVACLGLYGLAAFTAEQRTKEIGIRKVLGARVRDIVSLLAWQFSKPVLLANLIAWPIAWWLMREWLNSFDARIELGLMPFVASGLLALIIAVGTVTGHALYVARMSPAAALRHE
jgi:putative ABC transport system permease protein